MPHRRSQAGVKQTEACAKAQQERFVVLCLAAASTFKVVGLYSALGKGLYTVVLGTYPSCTCKAFADNSPCKHIIFLIVKFLEVKSDEIWYQNMYTTDETNKINEAFDTGRSSTMGPSNLADCAMCTKNMATFKTEACEGCGLHSHLECVHDAARMNQDHDVPFECTWCSATWTLPDVIIDIKKENYEFVKAARERHRITFDDIRRLEEALRIKHFRDHTQIDPQA